MVYTVGFSVVSTIFDKVETCDLRAVQKISGVAFYRIFKFLRYEMVGKNFQIIIFRPRNNMKREMLSACKHTFTVVVWSRLG
jgi:hypothetical protein